MFSKTMIKACLLALVMQVIVVAEDAPEQDKDGAVKAFVQQCINLTKADQDDAKKSVIKLEADLKLAKRKRQKEDVARLEAALADAKRRLTNVQQPDYLVIPLMNDIAVGSMGSLRALSVRVIEVVDDKNGLVNVVLFEPEHLGGRPTRRDLGNAWVTNTNTAAWIDDQGMPGAQDLKTVWRVAGIKRYESRSGKASVPMLEPVDITPHLPRK